MPAYLIVQSRVTDAETFQRYMGAAPAVVQAFGGEYLVRGGAMTVLEGGWTPPRLTVIRFPDRATAQAFYDSPGYTAARALRDGATALFDMVVVDGVADAG